jgi:protein gp37
MYITVIITRIGKTFHRDKENYCIRELGTVMPNGCKHTYENISFDKEEI